jgi:hypothetical protein
VYGPKLYHGVLEAEKEKMLGQELPPSKRRSRERRGSEKHYEERRRYAEERRNSGERSYGKSLWIGPAMQIHPKGSLKTSMVISGITGPKSARPF